MKVNRARVTMPDGMECWVDSDQLQEGSAPLMPTPLHDIESMGFGDSYAHICMDGSVMRYMAHICNFDDLVIDDPQEYDTRAF